MTVATNSSTKDSTTATKDLAKTEELIATLWRYAAEQKRPKGKKKNRDRRRSRPLVQPNEFDIVCTVGISKGKGRDQPSIKKRVLKLTSWKMNEYEYAKGSLPTLARGLFTYSEHDPSEYDLEGDEEENYVHVSKATWEGENDEDDYSSEGGDDENARKINVEERSKHGRILIRGYNKFFNLEEVKESKMSWIQEHTRAPYEVTLKENGCIIFMAGMPPGYYDEQDPEAGCIVSSKHFLGALSDKTGKAGTKAHSDMGREWLARCLKTKGKTMLEFGRWLWKNQITAVAELCDDDFEEHILEYPAERSGLYLHGLNYNIPDFQTWPSEEVYKAALEWGFHPTQYRTFQTVDEVMAFTNKVRDDGEYDHRPIEGFVVRCKVPKGEGEGEGGSTTAVRDHFFKIKYDEPYLMYREWREITKHLWSRRQRDEKDNTDKKKKKKKQQPPIDASQGDAAAAASAPVDTWVRMKYPLTKPYVNFVTRLMSENPELFANYNRNQGIIAIRDLFLQDWAARSQAEQDALLGVSTSNAAGAMAAGGAQGDFDRTLIVPIATIGCGKTTTSVALAELFGWAHVSSDDFNHFAKNTGQRFMKEVVHQLGLNDVVIADRNNHQFLHRERLLGTVRETWPKTRFVALYWSHEGKPALQIMEEAAERVRGRGKNHQVMTPEFCPDYMDVIQMFMRTFQPLNPLIPPDNGFHQVIEVQFGDDARSVVQKVIDQLVGRVKGANALPKPDKIDEAVRFAIEDWVPHRVKSGEAAKHHQQKMKKEQKKAKQQAVVQAKEDEAANTASDGSTATATAASQKKKKAKEPKYFGILLRPGAVFQALQDELQLSSPAHRANNESPLEPTSVPATTTTTKTTTKETKKQKKDQAAWEACHQRVQEWVDLGRFKAGHHVTLIHSSVLKVGDEARKQRAASIWKQYTDEVANHRKDDSDSTQTSDLTSAMASLSLNDTQAEMEAETLVWTDRLIAMPVRNVHRILPDGKAGEEYETTQQTLHITVALRDATVKPVESNDMLQEWRQRVKHGNGSLKEGEQAIWSYTFDKPVKLQGHLMGFSW